MQEIEVGSGGYIRSLLTSNADSPPPRRSRFLRMANKQPHARALSFALSEQSMIVPDALASREERLLVAGGIPPASDFGDHLGDSLVVILSRSDLTRSCVFKEICESEFLLFVVFSLPGRFARGPGRATTDILTARDSSGGRNTDDATLYVFEAAATDETDENVAEVAETDVGVLALHSRLQVANGLACFAAHVH